MVTKHRGRFLVPAAALGLWLLTPSVPRAEADPISLTHLNSTVTIDPASIAGVFAWSVDGTNHIEQQSFWLGIGTGSETDFGSLESVRTTLLGTRGLQAVYQDLGFEVEVRYLLTGDVAGSGHSQLRESVNIRNTSGSAMDFRLIQETDLDLGGTAANDIVEFFGPALWRQREGDLLFSETFATPAPHRVEAALFPFTLVHLLDDKPSLLNNVMGPIGPGDVTWASQWNFSLAPGETFAIDVNKEITIIPEPLTLFLVGTGLLGLTRGYARRLAARRKLP
jgi:hypothetical protein